VKNDHGSSSWPSRRVRSTQDRIFFCPRQIGAQIRACIAPGLVLQSPHVFTPGASLMEFIIVRVKGQPGLQVGVLINGQQNGTTGALITLGDPGWVGISVDLPNASLEVVDVTNTTATHPMEIEVTSN
jgi:hypothetical protein